MPAEVLKLDDFPRPNRVFKIPLRTEVSKYIQEKMGWPKEFCDHYGDKFWYFYQAKGWTVGKSPMKDWKAAFNSQWQNIRDAEDNKLLSKYLAEEKKSTDPIEYLNDCLEKHKRKEFKPSRAECVAMYDWLKGSGRMKLEKEIWDRIVEECGNSREYGKCLAVRALFDNYITNDKRFK